MRDLPYLVMEYIHGPSLQEKLDRTGPLELKEILRIGMQAAAGLAAAHAQGLVHRDIKPANILLENGIERVKLTDFGLARANDDAMLTQSGVVTGTPRFMAPEQARGDAIDHRADLFSLGSVLYNLCAGRPPFHATTTMGVLRQVSDESPRPLSQVDPAIPGWLVTIIETLHAKDPADRYQTAGEVAALLASHLAHIQDPSMLPLARAPERKPLPAQAPTGRRLLRRSAVAAGLVLVLTLGGLGAAESAGITRLADLVATVLRFGTPQGTLVVEIDDPAVKVTVDNEGGEVVITGAGAQEVRLRPGRHHLQATRDGKPVLTELVNITQGGKQTVRVSLETSQPAGAGTVIAPPVALVEREAPGAANAVLGSTRNASSLAKDWLKATYADQFPVYSVEFSPDGKTLAIASGDKTVKLWDVAASKVRATLSGHEDAVITVAVSPDGTTLASGGLDSTVRLWDMKTEREVATLRGHKGDIRRIAFSPEGKRLVSASRDGMAKIWDVGAHTEIMTLTGHGAMVSCAVFSPDGKTVATGSEDFTARLWDAATGKEEAVLDGSRNSLCSLAFTPDGKTLLGGSCDFTVKVWDVASCTLRNELTGQRGFVRDVATSPDGRLLATGGNDGVIRIWDAASGLELASIAGHEGTAKHVAFSPDGKTVASAGLDWTAKLWDVSTVRPDGPEHTPPIPLSVLSIGDIVAPRALAISPDGSRLVASGTHGFFTFWDISDPSRPGRPFGLQGHRADITSIAFAPDSKTFAAGSEDKTVGRYDASTGNRIGTLKTHLDVVTSVAYSPDRPIFVSGSRDRIAKFWDVVPWTERWAFRSPKQPVLSVAFSPDGKSFAAGLGDWETVEPGEVQLGLANGEQMTTLPGSLYGVKNVTFSPDSTLLAAGSGTPPKAGPVGSVTLWDLKTKQIRATVACPKWGISFVFAPDRKTLAVGQFAGRVLFYDIASGQGRSLLAAHTGKTTSGTLMPSGRPIPQGMIQAMAYSTDGKLLVTAGDDGTLKLWRIDSNQGQPVRDQGSRPDDWTESRENRGQK